MIKYTALAIIDVCMFLYAFKEEQRAFADCLINHSKDTCWEQMAGG